MRTIITILIIILLAIAALHARPTTAVGRTFIGGFEGGHHLVAYKCPGGVWTIGKGHTKGVYRGMVINEMQEEVFFTQDLNKYERYVETLFGDLPWYRNDARVSFAFNVGSFYGNLLKNLRAGDRSGDYSAAYHYWIQYNRAAGRVLNGLTKRRLNEIKLHKNLM